MYRFGPHILEGVFEINMLLMLAVNFIDCMSARYICRPHTFRLPFQMLSVDALKVNLCVIYNHYVDG